MRTFIDTLSERVDEYVDGNEMTVKMTQDDHQFFITVKDRIKKILAEQIEADSGREILNTTMRLLSYHEGRHGESHNKQFEELIKEKSNLMSNVIKVLEDVIENSEIDSHRVYIVNDSEEITIFTGDENECRDKSRKIQEIVSDYCECGCQEM